MRSPVSATHPSGPGNPARYPSVRELRRTAIAIALFGFRFFDLSELMGAFSARGSRTGSSFRVTLSHERYAPGQWAANRFFLWSTVLTVDSAAIPLGQGNAAYENAKPCPREHHGTGRNGAIELIDMKCPCGRCARNYGSLCASCGPESIAFSVESGAGRVSLLDRRMQKSGFRTDFDLSSNATAQVAMQLPF